MIEVEAEVDVDRLAVEVSEVKADKAMVIAEVAAEAVVQVDVGPLEGEVKFQGTWADGGGVGRSRLCELQVYVLPEVFCGWIPWVRELHGL